MWLSARATRTGRLGLLSVEGQEAASGTAPGAFDELSLPGNLYLGGVPAFAPVAAAIPVRTNFRGCVQKVSEDEDAPSILHTTRNGIVYSFGSDIADQLGRNLKEGIQ